MTEGKHRELMEQTLKEACTYGQQLAQACSKICQDFSGGREQEGLEMLSHFLEGVGCMSQALHMTFPAQQERKVSIDLAELPAALDPLVSALGNKDYGLVSDILSLEVQPLLNRWTSELTQAQE